MDVSLTLIIVMAVLFACGVYAMLERSLTRVLIGFLLLGVASAVGLQGRFAAADAALPHRRGFTLSLVMWATTIGSVTGPLLIGPTEPLAERFGLPELAGPFLVTVVAQLAASALYAFGLRPDPLAVARFTDGAGVAAAPAPGAAPGTGPGTGHGAAPAPGTAPGTRGTPSASTGEEAGRRSGAGRNPAVPLAQFAIAVGHFVMVLVMAMTPVHMQGIGVATSFIGVTMSLHIAGMWALTPVFGWLSDLVGPRFVVLAGQAMFIVTAVLIVAGPENVPMLVAALILLGLGWSASIVAGSAIVTKAVATDERTMVQGRTDMAMNLAGVLGGLVGGPLIALLGFPGLSLVALVPVALVVVTQMTRAARGRVDSTADARPRGTAGARRTGRTPRGRSATCPARPKSAAARCCAPSSPTTWPPRNPSAPRRSWRSTTSGCRRRPSATTWPCSRPRATSSRSTRRRGAYPRKRGTACSSTPFRR